MPLTAANATEVSSGLVRPVSLFTMVFPSGTLYITDINRSITVGGNTYSPSQMLLGVSDIEDNTDSKPRRISTRLSALDATVRARVFAGGFAFGKLNVAAAFLDANGAPVDAAIQLCVARLSNASVSIDATSGVAEINAETQAILLERNAAQLITPQSQRLRYAGDTACDNVQSVSGKRLNWGGKDVPTSTTGLGMVTVGNRNPVKVREL